MAGCLLPAVCKELYLPAVVTVQSCYWIYVLLCCEDLTSHDLLQVWGPSSEKPELGIAACIDGLRQVREPSPACNRFLKLPHPPVCIQFWLLTH